MRTTLLLLVLQVAPRVCAAQARPPRPPLVEPAESARAARGARTREELLPGARPARAAELPPPEGYVRAPSRLPDPSGTPSVGPVFVRRQSGPLVPFDEGVAERLRSRSLADIGLDGVCPAGACPRRRLEHPSFARGASASDGATTYEATSARCSAPNCGATAVGVSGSDGSQAVRAARPPRDLALDSGEVVASGMRSEAMRLAREARLKYRPPSWLPRVGEVVDVDTRGPGWEYRGKARVERVHSGTRRPVEARALDPGTGDMSAGQSVRLPRGHVSPSVSPQRLACPSCGVAPPRVSPKCRDARGCGAYSE